MFLLPQRLSLKHLLKEAELIFGVFLLVYTCKGQSLKTNRPQRVTATVGDDVVLPCYLGDAVNPDELVAEWGRLDLDPRFVYLWFEGREYLDDQNMAYKGRTSLFTNRLKDGDVSLRLKDVKHSDNGRFRCYNPKEMDAYFINRLVGSVSSPGMGFAGFDEVSSGVMLDCSSSGWYPEPEIIWLVGEGNIISAGPPEIIRGPDGLYTVSSRVTVEKRHNNNITCRVQQKDINQTRETHIYVQDGFFIPQSGCSVPITFSVLLGLTLLLGVITLIWKLRKTQISINKLKDEVNEERQQLMAEEKQNLTEKKSKLEEELKNRNEDQRSIDQLIERLMKMSEQLKEQKKRLSDPAEEAGKIIEENERELKAVDDEVNNQKENKVEKRAQGYLKLKEIIKESNEKLDKRKKDHQQVEVMTDILMKRTFDDVTKLKERKHEIENNVEEIKKQLEEMKTQM